MLLYALAIYGLSWIWKESDLFATTRNWIMQRSTFITQLLMCWYCTGFWAGIVVCLWSSEWSFGWGMIGTLLIWGCTGSASAALGNAAWEKLSLVDITNYDDEEEKEQ